MKQKPSDIIIFNAVYLLFGDFYENVEKTVLDKIDENQDIDYRYSFYHYTKATRKEDLIRKLWGSKCQNLITGVLIYLYKRDTYFSPKLNSFDDFFLKIYRHREILIKIGLGEHEPVFPFVNLINKEKKILLIRC